MRAGTLRRQLVAALEAAIRTRGPDAIALTADRVKATAAAIAGQPDDADVVLATLELGTRDAASVLGFHPEHVRRLVRGGRLPARRVGGDYRLLLDDLWPLIEARHRAPGRRRTRSEDPNDRAMQRTPGARRLPPSW